MGLVLRFLIPLSLVATVVSACDEEAPAGDVDAVETDVTDDGDAPDEVDTSDVSDTPDGDTGDTADTLDGGDTSDTRDTADDIDAGDTADSSDTTDSSDTADGDVGPRCDDLEPGDPAFDDHTVTHLPTVDCFFAYATTGDEPQLVKYVVPDLHTGTAAEAKLRFTESGFYQLHDEWYWFRLLNGAAIPGLAEPQPLSGYTFATIADVYRAFAGQTVLPLDLAFLGAGSGFAGRLYSPRFYALAALDGAFADRFFAVGTVVHYGPRAERPYPGEIWGLELEFSDKPTVDYLERLFAILEAHLPPELTGRLAWIPRSSFQDAVATQLEQARHWLGERIIRTSELVVPGEIKVYNEGIAAGRVHILDEDFSGNDVGDDDIAILQRVPDDVPPTRAIISAVPQTALAHVNLLAKSRGTPNAYVAGILTWPQLDLWNWNNQVVIIEATEARGVRWKAITDATQYNTYLAKLAPPIRHVQQVADLASAPLTVSLTEGGLAEMEALVPLAGGKCAGFLSFLEVPSMHTPDAPLAITIKPFVEHQAALVPLFRAAFSDPDFVGDARVRYLALEGEAAYRAANHDDPAALVVIEELRRDHPSDALGQVIARGGARQMMIDQPIRYETLRALREALVARFGFLAKTQGLRFRSSSTAEDVPGFNGAGLYVSNTGYLYPSELADPSDRAKTVEFALKQTWSSYWGFQAFEERRAGRIDHFEGNMGVAVHARFDDDKELANAVATFWRSDYDSPPLRKLVINVQKGSLSVTNPDGTLELPEIDEVHRVGDGAPEVVRVQASTVAEDGELLLSDEQLIGLFLQAEEHSGKWLARLGEGQPLSERPKTLVLDYELKYVKPGWPALASGEIAPQRILWRQSRVLDQVTKVVPSIPDPYSGGLPLAQYLPTDLRTATKSVEVERCDSEWADLRVYQAWTEASQAELFPFAQSPFVYRVFVRFKKAPPGLSPSLSSWLVQWTNLGERSFGPDGARVTVAPGIAQTLGIDGFSLAPAPGGFTVWRGGTEFSGTCVRDQKQPYQSAAEYLRGLLN